MNRHDIAYRKTAAQTPDRKSTRLNSSHLGISYAVFCLKKINATGIYGVLGYSVSRRTREIGIRRAVGAGQREILAIVGRRAVILIGAGTAIRLAIALVAGRS